jgi:2,3,4,5-tetrahydropyridine-2-carboxylate N-succinyltransferase
MLTPEPGVDARDVDEAALRRLEGQVTAMFAGDAPLDAAAVERAITLLDQGVVRVAEPREEGGRRVWVTQEWLKQAILLYFRVRKLERMEVGPFEYYDKIPLKRGFERLGVRVVPPATARYGSFLSPGVVLMPSYVNIGAWVGPGTMVDTWATVGSCAQIGANVHLAGGVGIGGVLEPVQARPVIVEDGAFIGSRCVVVNGVRVGEQAVLGANTVVTDSTPVIDVTGTEPVVYKGEIPPRAVVVPGSRTRRFPAGEYQLATGLIVGWRSAATDQKVSLNQVLREFGIVG